MKGLVFDIQEMCIHDGPGGRVTIFLKGCPLRCVWCHNPEGQNFQPEFMLTEQKCIQCNACKTETGRNPSLCPTGALTTCGKWMSVEEIVQLVLKLKDTLTLMEGGVTFSGGEPTSQPEFLLECLKELQKQGIHTCIETCGYCPESIFEEIIQHCDVVLMDIKLMDDELHQKYTGVSNQLILKNAKKLMETHPAFCFRTPCIEEMTDTNENLSKIEAFIQESPWEKLPSNPLRDAKRKLLEINKAS